MKDFKLSHDEDYANDNSHSSTENTSYENGFTGDAQDFDNIKTEFDLGGDGTNRQKKEKKKRKKKDKTPANPIFLTKKKLAIIFILVITLSCGGAFGGMYLYESYYPTGSANKSKGSVTSDGYTLSKATGSELTVEEIAKQNLEAVVEIKTESVQQDNWLSEYVTEGAGSGVIIKSNGYIITNNHVIEGASKIYVTLHNDKQYTATLVGADEENDIAILKINAKNLSVVTYGDSSELSIGDMSVIIGNPLGELGGTVTAGIISSLDREITIDGQPMTLLQTDASVNPGNSGGGMFDQYGHLVGVVVAKSSGSDVEGLGFAIPINTAADIANQIMKNGKATSTSGYSGMSYAQNQNGNVYIQEVNEDFAKKAGFQAGDQVLAVDDTAISDLDTLSSTIKKHKSGDKVTFTIARNGQRMEISLTLHTKDS